MNIIEEVKKEIMKLNDDYIKNIDNFNFWEQHIKYVVKESINLAEKYNADKEIVELGALLHDVALIANVGTKVDHHANGVIIAEKLLKSFDYPQSKLDRI